MSLVLCCWLLWGMPCVQTHMKRGLGGAMEKRRETADKLKLVIKVFASNMHNPAAMLGIT